MTSKKTSKKNKTISKQKRQSKRRITNQKKEIRSEIDRTDPLYQQINQKYNKRHKAMTRATELGLKFKGKTREQLIDNIYLETKQQIKISKKGELKGKVLAQNTEFGSQIQIAHELPEDIVIVTDTNPSFIKEVEANTLGDNIIAIKSRSLANEPLETVIQVNPKEFKQVRQLESSKEQINPQESSEQSSLIDINRDEKEVVPRKKIGNQLETSCEKLSIDSGQSESNSVQDVVKNTHSPRKDKIYFNTYSELHGNRLLPTLSEPIHKKGASPKLKQTNRKLLKEYQEKNLFPFYYPSNSRDLLPLKVFENIPEVDYLAEKESLLPDVKRLKTPAELARVIEEKKQKQQEKSKESTQSGRGRRALTVEELIETTNTYVVQTGQHLQTQSFKSDKGHDWVGLYFQKTSRASRSNPIPSVVKAKEIRVDNDDAGHFIAYCNNLYAFGDPFIKNLVVGDSEERINPDEFRAMRFLATSVINTLGMKRNLAIQDAIWSEMGKTSLKYRTNRGLDNLIISEQIVEIVKAAQNQNVVVRVKTPDRSPIDFNVDFEAWNEAKPVIRFIEDGTKDPETGKIKYHPLDSDTLLKVIVRKFNIDSVSGQRLLEGLHNQGWITYPRIDVQRAEEEPIRILTEEKREILRKLMAREKTDEKLTSQEFDVLQIVYESEKSANKKENFVKNGYWLLESGDLQLTKKDTVLANEPLQYDPDVFDIEIHKKTIDEDDMLRFLIENGIGTPATRTAQLERLRKTAVLIFRDDNYLIDRRGYYMVGAHKVMEREEVPLVKDLLKEINDVSYGDFDSLNRIVNRFQFLDRDYLAQETRKEAEKLIEVEHDFTFLDSF